MNNSINQTSSTTTSVNKNITDTYYKKLGKLGQKSMFSHTHAAMGTEPDNTLQILR
jgi:hypothetical protein